jgi:GalNAc-alpha-(1->4)-GalNAc-alpha-(1->3)-diNAcBac-PP-undecaprenol alpha-1,4-N-acetyl-D-galactosaminyltransferase
MVPTNAGKIKRLIALRKYIKSYQPDIIISFLPNVNVAALLSSLGLDLPVLVSERSYPPAVSHTPSYIKVLRRLLYRYSSGVVVQNEQVATWVKNSCSVDATVIPNPVSASVFQNTTTGEVISRPTEKERYILSVGRLIPSKRVDILIDAFAALASSYPEWNLEIIGEGISLSDLESKVDKLGLADRVNFRGFTRNTTRWYESADIFCLCSKYEGFPNAMLEAMAFGVPTIAFDVPTGPREISQNGTAAMLLEDKDHVINLVGSLNLLMKSSEKRKHLSEIGRQATIQYRTDNVIHMWDDLINSLIQQR